jgi:hypothetical protein
MLVGCAGAEEGPDLPVAKAYDQVLSWTDLRQVIPLDATPEDSAAMADQYIEVWMKQQAVLHMAERNQATEGMAMEAQLEDYRRSLVIFNYEQALVDQKLDTAVSEGEIERYYADHQPNFELKETIVRMRWFKVNEPDKRILRRMEERFLKGAADDLRELEIWLAQNGVSINDRSMNWIPGSTENGAWFLEIIERRAQNSVSPLDLVRSDIRAILLNQRKIQLIEDMRSSVYAQAIENKDVERIAP